MRENIFILNYLIPVHFKGQTAEKNAADSYSLSSYYSNGALTNSGALGTSETVGATNHSSIVVAVGPQRGNQSVANRRNQKAATLQQAEEVVIGDEENESSHSSNNSRVLFGTSSGGENSNVSTTNATQLPVIFSAEFSSSQQRNPVSSRAVGLSDPSTSKFGGAGATLGPLSGMSNIFCITND